MAKPKIGKVTVIYPSTTEGMAALEGRFTQFNTRLLECLLDKCNASLEAKLAYIESLNGRVPWAGDKRIAESFGTVTTANQ